MIATQDKMVNLGSLVETLQKMAASFARCGSSVTARSKITAIELNLKESKPENGSWCGIVTIYTPPNIRATEQSHYGFKSVSGAAREDVRYFKIENGFLTFMSRKRKLK